MLNRRWIAAAALLAPVLSLSLCGSASAARGIEAVAGRRYTLTNDHGPWMIMAATFHTTAKDGTTDIGKSPEEAADELVLELRQQGIPAYVFSMEQHRESMITYDTEGRQVRQKNLRRVTTIGVLAGNYSSHDDNVARDTLKWLKRYDPDCLKEGVVFDKTENRPTPLAGAFLTMNPRLSPEEIAAQKELDPFVLRLNHRQSHSLLENEGRYTLVIATFGGKSSVQKPLNKFTNKPLLSEDNDLDRAGWEARSLAQALRDVENVDAYVWHNRYQSIVAVGSFTGPNDPAITVYRQRFASDEEINAILPAYATGVKTLAVDGRGNKVPDRVDVANGATAAPSLPSGFRIWAFDPNPHLMAVPHKRR